MIEIIVSQKSRTPRNTGTPLGAKFLAAALFGAGGCHLIIGLDEFVDAPPPAGGCQSAADCPGGEHATATCEAGVCGLACEGGYADCTDAPGCETGTAADRANCGGCGVSCAAFCEAGECNDPVDIAAGPTAKSVCALLRDGSVWCWGLLPGADGLGEVTPTPTRIDLPMPALQIATSSGAILDPTLFYGHTCVLLEDRTVRCWGSNHFGQLGLGNTQPSPTPEDVGLSNIDQIAVGFTSTCAVSAGGQLFCWGENTSGQIGNNTTTDALTPTPIMDSVAQISIGQYHACAVMLDGSLMCWGLNLFGCLGLGAGAPDQVLIPNQVGTWKGYKRVACGAAHTCAQRTNGVACWGFNGGGQLGLTDTADRDTPTVLNISTVDMLASGASHTAALIGSDVFMWGDNAYRQLGTEDPFDAVSPTRISLDGAMRFALTRDSSCALVDSGEVRCWGANSSGQLGDGTATDRATPVAVSWPR